MAQHGLPFEVIGGSPVVVTVEHKGKKFELRVALGVLEVTDTGRVDDKGMPVFEVHGGLSTSTRPKEDAND